MTAKEFLELLKKAALVDKGVMFKSKDKNKEEQISFMYVKGNITIDILEFLVKRGVNINKVGEYTEATLIMTSKNGFTDITKSLIENEVDIVQYLVNIRADFDLQNKDGYLLIYAAEQGYTDIVKFLIEQGADVNKSDKYGWTALAHAARKGHLDIVKYLVKSKLDADKALIHVAIKGKLDVAKYLVEECKADINTVSGYTVLTYAIINKHIKMVEYLLKHGADLNLQGDNGETALMYATKYGYTDIVTILLKYGANLNLQDNSGETALICATKRGYTDIVVILLKHGADLNLQGNSGETALICATKKEIRKILEIWQSLYEIMDEAKYLIEKGTNIINIVDKQGKTLLMHLLEKNKNTEAKYLIEKGTNLHKEDNQGKGILTYLIENGNVDLLKLSKQVKELSDNKVLEIMLLQKQLKFFTISNKDEEEKLNKRYEIAKERVANIANIINLKTLDSIRQIREANNICDSMKEFLKNEGIELEKLVQEKQKLEEIIKILKSNKNNDEKSISALMENIPDINYKNSNGDTILSILYECKKYDIINEFIKENKIDLDYYNNTQIIEKLIQEKKNIDWNTLKEYSKKNAKKDLEKKINEIPQEISRQEINNSLQRI